MAPEDKIERLKKIIASRHSMLIAYSGGVDSALLGVITREILGKNSRCILLDSPVVPRAAVRDAEETARKFGLDLEIVPVPVMNDERFVKNPSERCYFCKKSSATLLRQRKDELGFSCIADGINVSDTGEHRPGITASTEEGIIHPFIEAGITKDDIRNIARERGCFFWNKPSAACLSSRIPYGEEITTHKLHMIEQAENFLAEQGFLQFRVRLHGNIARIELTSDDIPKIMSIRNDVVKKLKKIGFSYVALDLEGYRSGSMDEVLREQEPVNSDHP
jgi:uncharacterized protein